MLVKLGNSWIRSDEVLSVYYANYGHIVAHFKNGTSLELGKVNDKESDKLVEKYVKIINEGIHSSSFGGELENSENLEKQTPIG
jgi:hypothetical protein